MQATPPSGRRSEASPPRTQRLSRTVAGMTALGLVLLYFVPHVLGVGTSTALRTAPPAPAPARLIPTQPPRPSPSALVLPSPPALSVSAGGPGLSMALTRAQAQAHGSALWVLGGLSRTLTSGQVQGIDPVSGTATTAGTLAAAVHDAASVPFGNGVLLLGGGGSSPIATVQTFDGRTSAIVGQLPEPRSGAVAVAIGSTIYLLGGNDGSGDIPSVLSTTDGKTFHVVGQLKVAVQEAGAVAIGSTIYLIGGTSNGVQTPDIQSVNVTTGATAIAGRLPVSLSGESVFSLGGAVFVAGGRSGASYRNQIDSLNPATGALARSALLPEGLAAAATARIGTSVYLVGGENPAQLKTVIRITAAG